MEEKRRWLTIHEDEDGIWPGAILSGDTPDSVLCTAEGLNDFHHMEGPYTLNEAVERFAELLKQNGLPII